MKPIEIFTALDLEMNKPSGKIIQIGACVGNIKTGDVLEKLSIFVNPSEEIDPFITNLTKIKQPDVDNGLSLIDAYEKLKEMHFRHKAFINAIVWGGGDTQELGNQLSKYEEFCNYNNWCFGRRWIDAKTLFVSWRLANGQPIQGGLAKSMLKVGLKFEGQKHNAMDDAVNTFRIYVKMLKLLTAVECK